ncbi:MAG: TRAP transporter small permease subunit [Xanthobacteraceae bacterium]|nr:TRAP transporter small permease subunit [Xanthobacteraceae bacterium]
MILKRLDHALSAVERAASFLAAVALFLIMSIVATDVALRYLFNRPWGWSFDFISLYVIVGLFFLALSRTFAVNGHISVDLLHHYLNPSARRICEVVICLLSAVLFAWMTQAGAARAWQNYIDNDILAGVFPWPAWAHAAFVPLGAGMITLRLVLSTVCHVYTLATGREVIPLPPIAGSAQAIQSGSFE